MIPWQRYWFCQWLYYVHLTMFQAKYVSFSASALCTRNVDIIMYYSQDPQSGIYHCLNEITDIELVINDFSQSEIESFIFSSYWALAHINILPWLWYFLYPIVLQNKCLIYNLTYLGMYTVNLVRHTRQGQPDFCVLMTTLW